MPVLSLTNDAGQTQQFDTTNADQILDIAGARNANLCSAWPATREGLEILKACLTGGARAFWTPLINGVEALGDKACPGVAAVGPDGGAAARGV